MKNYKYTKQWFTSKDLEQFLKIDREKELHILEIGSFEGESTVWFLNNVLQHSKSTITCIDPWDSYSQNSKSFQSYSNPENEWHNSDKYDTFKHNIKESGVEEKVLVKRGLSHEILPELLVENNQYDIVFIDGNHVAPYVLTDAMFSWYMLKDRGIMIFDDYLWRPQLNKVLTPKLAVDSFITNFQDYCEVIYDGYRKAIKKVMSDNE